MTPQDDCLYLVGHTPLDQYLDFVEAELAGDVPGRAALADDWRAADDRRRALEDA